jgi:hypothetical protein
VLLILSGLSGWAMSFSRRKASSEDCCGRQSRVTSQVADILGVFKVDFKLRTLERVPSRCDAGNRSVCAVEKRNVPKILIIKCHKFHLESSRFWFRRGLRCIGFYVILLCRSYSREVEAGRNLRELALARLHELDATCQDVRPSSNICVK